MQLAKERGCSPQEIKQWRMENKYTWHECKDCKTMQLVPTEVHGNIPHSGGIAETKSRISSLRKEKNMKQKAINNSVFGLMEI